jgi:predicted transcriptional regulator
MRYMEKFDVSLFGVEECSCEEASKCNRELLKLCEGFVWRVRSTRKISRTGRWTYTYPWNERAMHRHVTQYDVEHKLKALETKETEEAAACIYTLQ